MARNQLPKRERLAWRKKMVKARAKEAALKITAFYFDESTPQFLVDAVINTLADAAYELGIFEERLGC